MKNRRGLWILGVALASALAGCVGGGKGLSSDDKEKLKPYILDTAPADIAHKVDINFENKVHIIGYKVEPELAKPGTEVKLTYYWRDDDTVDEGWKLFTHLKDPVSGKLDNLDGNGPIRELRNDKPILGLDKWQKGKVYVDEQTYKMPDWVQGPELEVMVGVWKGESRLRILSGPNDGDNRAKVLSIKTGLTPKPAEPAHSMNDVPTISPVKMAANDKIVIDGKDDDKAWGAAANIGPFVDVGTGKPDPSSPVNGSAKLTWDDQNMYVFFQVSDADIIGGFGDPKPPPATGPSDFTVTLQPKLWTKDTVEIMTDPDPSGDNKDYYELQISPQNKVFHAQFDELNKPKTEPNGPFGHEDWDPKLKSAVVVTGTMDKPGDKDTGYTVEAAIPWAAFTKAANHPPKPGDTWRMNFYAMKNNGGVAWSPILRQGNFHTAKRFGKVVWTVPGVAAPTASGSASAPAGTGSAAAMASANATRKMMNTPLRP